MSKCKVHGLTSDVTPANKCRPCANARKTSWRGSNRHAARQTYLRKSYGISNEDYSALEQAQNYTCAICNRREKQNKHLAVDHNHSTGEVRGLLCFSCNTALGLLEENPESLRNMLIYLGVNNG